MVKKNEKWLRALRIGLGVVFIGVVGTIAGILGGLISPQIFLPEDIIQLRPIVFEDRSNSQKISDKAVPVSDIVEDTTASMMGVYHTPKSNASPYPEANFIPTAKDFLGFALVGTTDGWVILPASVAGIPPEQIRLMNAEKKEFTLSIIVSDPATGIQFGKFTVSQDDTLKPVQFDTSTDFTGRRTVKIDNFHSGSVFSLTAIGYVPADTASGMVQSTSDLKKRFNYSESYVVEGMPIVTEKKEVIGVTQKIGIVPMSYVKDVFTRVLRTKELGRPTTQLHFIDISSLPVSFTVAKRGPIKNGAYIIASKRSLALHGPDGIVSFLQGDIITNVNGDLIDLSRSLAEAFQQYKKGDTISIDFLRKGEKQSSKITL